MKHKNVGKKKLNQCQYAFQTYQHLLMKLKDILRSAAFNSMEFYVELQCILMIVYWTIVLWLTNELQIMIIYLLINDTC